MINLFLADRHSESDRDLELEFEEDYEENIASISDINAANYRNLAI